jgi:hypothetical protein
MKNNVRKSGYTHCQALPVVGSSGLISQLAPVAAAGV